MLCAMPLLVKRSWTVFKTRYRIDLRDDEYLWIGYKKWYWFKWVRIGFANNMEDAMQKIALHKNPPEPVKPIKPVTVYEE